MKTFHRFTCSVMPSLYSNAPFEFHIRPYGVNKSKHPIPSNLDLRCPLNVLGKKVSIDLAGSVFSGYYDVYDGIKKGESYSRVLEARPYRASVLNSLVGDAEAHLTRMHSNGGFQGFKGTFGVEDEARNGNSSRMPRHSCSYRGRRISLRAMREV